MRKSSTTPTAANTSGSTSRASSAESHAVSVGSSRSSRARNRATPTTMATTAHARVVRSSQSLMIVPPSAASRPSSPREGEDHAHLRRPVARFRRQPDAAVDLHEDVRPDEPLRLAHERSSSCVPSRPAKSATAATSASGIPPRIRRGRSGSRTPPCTRPRRGPSKCPTRSQRTRRCRTSVPRRTCRSAACHDCAATPPRRS